MACIFNNRTGFALVGLLVAVCIIAALAYGSSFFWKKDKNNAGIVGNEIDILNQAKKDLSEVNKTTAAKQQEADETMGNGGKEITITNIKADDILTSPVAVEGAAKDNALMVELRNSEHETMVKEPVAVREGSFKINLSFEFSNTKDGFVAVYGQGQDGSERNLIEIPVKFGNSGN